MNKSFYKFSIILVLLCASTASPQSRYNREMPYKIDTLLSSGYYLKPYYSTPFSPVTFTVFSLPDTCSVKLFVSDTTATNILDIIYQGQLEPGNYKFDFTNTINKYRSEKKILRGFLNFEATRKIRGISGTEKTIFLSQTGIVWIYF